jgi:hypothetical protein
MPVYPAAARNASTSCASPGCRRRRARSGTAAIVTLRGSAAWDMTAPPSGVRPGRFCTGRDGGRRTDETLHSGQTAKPETPAGPVTRTEKTPRATAGASGRTPQNRLARAQRRAGLPPGRWQTRRPRLPSGRVRPRPHSHSRRRTTSGRLTRSPPVTHSPCPEGRPNRDGAHRPS